MFADLGKAVAGAAIVGVFLTVLASQPAAASDLPPGYTCQSVRAAYNKWWVIGRPAIRRYLISVEGYTQSQVRAAERCLK